jgi:phosphoketolase
MRTAASSWWTWTYRLLETTPSRYQSQQQCDALLGRHHAYIREHFEDLPEVRNWVWRDEKDLFGKRN